MAVLSIVPAAVLLLLAMLLLAAGVVLVVRTVRAARRYPSEVAVGTPWTPGAPESGAPLVPDGPAQAGALLWRWAGILVGGSAAYLTITTGTLGRGELFAAPIFGLCALAGTLLGELTMPSPGGATRRAQLHVRRVRDYVPPVLGAIVAVATVVLVVLASVTTAAASPDDMGRAGRYLLCSTGAGSGPWTGSFYTLPGSGLVLVGLALAGLSLRRIVRRPRPADTAAADDALRRRSAEVVTAAVGLLVLVPLLGVGWTAGVELIALAGNCGHDWWTGAGWGLVGLAVVAFALAGWCVVLLLWPLARSRARTAA